MQDLETAYRQYCEMVDNVYDYGFDSRRRNEYYRKAARKCGVDIMDLKHYANCKVLGIDYHPEGNYPEGNYPEGNYPEGNYPEEETV